VLNSKRDPLLDRAAILAKKRDFENAYKILRGEEDRYYGSFKYYQLSGIISLYSGNYVESHEYLQLARRIKPKDKWTMLGFAVHYLKRMKTDQAVDCYLDVLETDPQNKIAKYALNVIRKHASPDNLSDWISIHDNLVKLFPPIPSPLLNKKSITNFSLALAVSIVLVFGFLFITNAIQNPFRFRSQRPISDYFLLPEERLNPVQTAGFFLYILSPDEIISLHENALAYFAGYRDERAKVLLNKILRSNASEAVKNRANLMIRNMAVPGFDTFRRQDNFTMSEVRAEPALFENVHVIWTGMATNVSVTDTHTQFDLLVGYDTRITLEGIVPVIFNIPVAINTDRPLEVLGRITLMSITDIKLEGISIHQAGRL